MNFEKSEIYSKFETQTKYGLSYWLYILRSPPGGGGIIFYVFPPGGGGIKMKFLNIVVLSYCSVTF